ncbi:hypothetical protein Tco_1480108 [Tanacetum coccineum]
MDLGDETSDCLRMNRWNLIIRRSLSLKPLTQSKKESLGNVITAGMIQSPSYKTGGDRDQDLVMVSIGKKTVGLL